MVTTIQIDDGTKALLEKLKVHQRQSFNELIVNLAQDKIREKKPVLVKDLFGKFPRLRRWSAQELKDEARAGWMSDSDRKREEEWARKNK